MVVIVRASEKDDLPEILGLGKEFGHLMLYQKDPDLMESYLPRILVAQEVGSLPVVGYYHYIVSGDPGFTTMLRVYRQFPRGLVEEADSFGFGKLCICMQGASHREVFREFVQYLQMLYTEVWCYPSIKSGRIESYKELGFEFDSGHTFWNCNKGDVSTYLLGRWTPK